MKLLRETTDWKTPTPNHVYIFDGSSMKIAGYIREGEVKAVKFSKPMSFDKRRRTFVEVRARDFDLSAFKE